MADYISREDAIQCANDLSVDLLNDRLDSASYGAQAVAEWLKDVPAADVVEVVRCKDCIHYDDRWRRCFYWGKLSDIHVIERGYCWRAERRADNGK